MIGIARKPAEEEDDIVSDLIKGHPPLILASSLGLLLEYITRDIKGIYTELALYGSTN